MASAVAAAAAADSMLSPADGMAAPSAIAVAGGNQLDAASVAMNSSIPATAATATTSAMPVASTAGDRRSPFLSSAKFFVKGDFSGDMSIDKIKGVLRAHGAQIVPSVGASTICLSGTDYCPPKPQDLQAAMQRTYIFDPAGTWLQSCIEQQKLLPVPKEFLIDPARLTRAHGDTIEQRLRAVGFSFAAATASAAATSSPSAAAASSPSAAAAYASATLAPSSDSKSIRRSQPTPRSMGKRRGDFFASEIPSDSTKPDSAFSSAKRHCRMDTGAAVAAAAAASEPAASAAAVGPSSSSMPALASAAASMPTSQLRSSLGWTIIPPSRATTRMAKAWQEHTADVLPKLDPKLPKGGAIRLRGGGIQTHFGALLSAAESRPSMHHVLARQHERDKATLRSLLRTEIGAADEAQLQLACSAHLSFSPGCTVQELHMDIQPRELAKQCYVGIAYLTSCLSTHLPVDGATTDHLWNDVSPRQLREEVKVDDRFSSQPVAPGAVLLMRGDTAHFGPANLSQDTRLCAYFLFSPQAGCGQATNQRYPHGV